MSLSFFLNLNTSVAKILRNPGISNRHSITGMVLLVLLASAPVQAHLVLQDPAARTQDTDLTIDPCGGKPAAASVATYPAGTDIEITFDLPVQHVASTSIYISYDNFVTRSKLATMSTTQTGVYKKIISLPVAPLGPAVLQVNHQNYYSCADITLEERPEFVLNAGLNDAWYFPDTSGQGFFITVFPVLNAVSLAWFTYDTELPPLDATANLGDPGHRWLTAIGSITGNRVIMDIDITSGGIFDDETDVDHTMPPGADGTLILTFESCSAGTVEYDIPSINRQGVIPIERVADDNIVICEALNSD
jgi:hypothetical protein